METNIVPFSKGLLELIRKSIGGQFVIPVYQRNYTWSAVKEVKQFLDDIRSILNGEAKNHFLGIMIYLEKSIDATNRELSVIDGQQRLTTTFLTLYAIKNLFKEQGENKLSKKIERQYLTEPDDDDDEKLKYKLKPLVSDDEVYKCIVEDRIDEIDNLKSNIFLNYKYILDELKKIVSNGKSLIDVLNAMDRLYVVGVPLTINDNAQKIFESINATGVKLTASDLIRNYLLMDLPSDTQEKYYSKYWMTIEKYVNGDAKEVELFFRMFLVTQNFELPNKNIVYRLFVKWFVEKKATTEKKLKLIVEYAKAYNAIYKQDITKLPEPIRNPIKEFRWSVSQLPSSALLYFYMLYKDKKISVTQLADAINLINNYLFRRSLCNCESSSITRLFPAVLRDVVSDCNGVYINVIDVLKKNLVVKNVGNSMYMPDDKKMREYLYSANMYNLKLYLKVAFNRIEHDNNPAPVDFNALSIEHLMPQTPTQEWLDTLGVDIVEYQNNVHRLGNLTLAAKHDNSAMGNKGWQYKNEVLKNTSHVKMNEEILKVDKWNIEEIDKRTKSLIDKIIAMYPYPEIKNDVISKEEIIIADEKVHVKAFLSLDTGCVEVDSGSQLASPDGLFDYNEDYIDVEEERKRLIDEEVIAEIDGCLQFIQPYSFYPTTSKVSALSFVANLILYNKNDGLECWKNTEGKLLKNLTKLKKLLP